MIGVILKYWKFAAMAGCLIAGSIGGWTLRDWKADADELKALRNAEIERDRIASKIGMLAFEYEQSRNAIENSKTETKATIREVFRNVEVPADCAVPDDARRLLETAVNRANSTIGSEPSKSVR